MDITFLYKLYGLLDYLISDEPSNLGS